MCRNANRVRAAARLAKPIRLFLLRFPKCADRVLPVIFALLRSPPRRSPQSSGWGKNRPRKKGRATTPPTRKKKPARHPFHRAKSTPTQRSFLHKEALREDVPGAARCNRATRFPPNPPLL